jgi:lipopolysaccharide/colanic/teichoic acid biosynthesis glycosyltransferase
LLFGFKLSYSSSNEQKWYFFGLDFVLVLVSAYGAYLLRQNFNIDEMHLTEFFPYALATATGSAFGFLIFGTHRSVWRYVSLSEVLLVIKAVTLGLAIALILVFTINRLESVARSVPLIHWGLAIALLVAARLTIRFVRSDDSMPQTHGQLEQPEYVLVVGLNRITELYLRCVSDLARKRISVAGILVENPAVHGRLIKSTEVLGSPVDLMEILGRCNVHGISVKKVVITTQLSQLSSEARDLLLKLERSGIVELDFFEKRLGFSPFLPSQQASNSSPSLTADTSNQMLAGTNDNEAGLRNRIGYRFAKRTVDVIGSLVALILLTPAFLIASVIAAYDVGWPIFFWQVRPGLHGRPFRISKFRTMGPGHRVDGTRIPDDERVSKFGNFLRRVRFDEIPQLVNILMGDMSFVGPRPLLPVDQPINRALRLSVRPGLTGWAQINGGKDLSIAEKTELDLWYVRNASFAVDAKIMFLTAYFLLTGNIANEQFDSIGGTVEPLAAPDDETYEKPKVVSN